MMLDVGCRGWVGGWVGEGWGVGVRTGAGVAKGLSSSNAGVVVAKGLSSSPPAANGSSKGLSISTFTEEGCSLMWWRGVGMDGMHDGMDEMDGVDEDGMGGGEGRG